jgi:hypothetical protein
VPGSVLLLQSDLARGQQQAPPPRPKQQRQQQQSQLQEQEQRRGPQAGAEVLLLCRPATVQGAGGGIYELGWNQDGSMLAACFQGKQLLVAELRK